MGHVFTLVSKILPCTSVDQILWAIFMHLFQTLSKCKSKDQISWAIFLHLSQKQFQIEKQGPNFAGHFHSLVTK